jgi:3-phenylpropionate/trans-cinnamate dioxygenase ferredoxin subunit
MAPPVVTRNPIVARGDRLITVAELGPGGVREVETEAHGTLAVGVSQGRPFAVSNVCRHQFAKLGQGRVDETGCLECPWHRARYDVMTGEVVQGPQGRIFGFPPYSKAVQAVGNAAAKLRSFPVVERDGVIFLAG